LEIAFSTLASLYIIMLGPFKLILPFATATANAEAATGAADHDRR